MTPSAPATTTYCVSCAAVLEAGARYCVNCGHRIARPVPQAQPAPQARPAPQTQPAPQAQPAQPRAPSPAPVPPRAAASMPPATPPRPVAPAQSQDADFHLAGFGIRLVGFAIDLVVYLFIALIAILSIGSLGIFAASAALLVFNSIGVSPGKAVVGIRIVNRHGNPPGVAAGLGRTLVAIASWWALWLGYFWAAGDRHHRTWHDLAADTYVIRG